MKARTALLALTAFIVLLAAACTPTKEATRKPTPAPRPAAATTEATEAATSYPTPKPADFQLTVKTLSKQCFGSAGCNLTYRIEAAWDQTFDPAKTYEVVYEVRGGEDSPQINTMTVTGDSYERPQEETVSTSSAKRKLTAAVTSVEEA